VLTPGSRELSLRALEAARVFRVLERPWVIVTGSSRAADTSETAELKRSLVLLGVPAERVVDEGNSRSTLDHTIHVPPLLAARGVKQFVLVTSRQHMARSLRAFRAAGFDPVPSSPEFFVPDDGGLSNVIPTGGALEASTSMLYDVFAMLYYRLKGWA
jgi:uncharacterized SAM-binding protein YcdF (DUF218 family)